MEKGFRLSETKNCRKYTKYVYLIDHPIDYDFIDSLAYFGKAKITYFSQFVTDSLDMFKIRNYELRCEIAGSINGNDLIVTLEQKDDNIADIVESEIEDWISTKRIHK